MTLPHARKCGVYRVRCKTTNRSYYGSSANIVQRFSNHRAALKNGDHKNPLLSASWAKYGAEDHEFEIVILCERASLRELENDYVHHYGELNVSRCVVRGVLPSDSKPDLSQVTALTNDMRSNARMSGKKLTPEAREKIRQAARRQHAEGRGPFAQRTSA